MSNQEIARLFRTVKVNSSLREHLNSAPNLTTFVTMAQEVGYTFTIEEWQQTTGCSVEELKCKVSEIPGS